MPGRSAAHDGLLTPTVRVLGVPGRTPWRPSSTGLVAFLGGVLAGTAIAWVNAGRLGAARRDRLRVGLIGVAGFALLVGVAVAVPVPDGLWTLRWAMQIVAITAYLAQARVLRQPARAFEVRDGDYGSLWLPGLAAVLVGATVEALVLLVVMVVAP